MSRRTERVNELVRKELSWLLASEVNDPRLPLLVTITRVSVSTDMRYARVLVSIMGTREEKLAAIGMLQSAARFLQKRLYPRLALRYVPSLHFQLDESIEESMRMFEAIDNLQKSSLSET